MAKMTANRPIGMERNSRTSTQTVPSPWGNEGRQCKPKSPHILHVVEDRHKHSTHSRTRQCKNGKNGVGVKEDKPEGSGTHTKVRTPPTCIQRVWFGDGEKRGLL